MIYVPCDIETNGLLDELTKIHCVSMNRGGEIRSTTNYDDMRKLFSRTDVVFVGHVFVGFDAPAIEKVLGVVIKAQIVDTCGVSYYLHPNRPTHNLADYGEEFGVPKPKIDDWDNLTEEEYVHRCEEDVKILSLLWEQQLSQLNELYESEAVRDSLLRYLSFKMYTVRLQEQSPFTVDYGRVEDGLEFLGGILEEKVSVLKEAMPTVGVITKKNKPKVLYKNDGSITSRAESWKELCEQRGVEDWESHAQPIEVTKDYDEPNPKSPIQIKDWLFSLGWKPASFSDGANGKVPQVYIKDADGESILCPSVSNVVHPAIEALDSLGVLKHRIGAINSIKASAKDGRVALKIHGFTSTLRMRHIKPLVNLPKPKKKWGEYVRGCLTCDEGHELCDSDLASLENMVKLDLIYPLNPDKVSAQLTPDFDPHIEIGVLAGMITEEDAEWFKNQKTGERNDDPARFNSISSTRQEAKQVTYSAQYGVGKRTLAARLGVSMRIAQKLLDAYWQQNAEVKVVARGFETKKCLGKTWVRNPYNKFWYELRSEKDRFSAVVQSTGDFICYLWCQKVLDKRPQLTMVYHDQLDFILKTGHRKAMTKILKDSIGEVNKMLKLNVPMDISINFDSHFDRIH